MLDSLKQLQATMDSVIKGKSAAVRIAVVTLIGRGNLLIEDVPGVGKTTLVFALAKATDCSFQRIQFTSDLLPSDILGISVFSREKGEFEFKPGPVFSNIVLADEINRKGQLALRMPLLFSVPKGLCLRRVKRRSLYMAS